MGVMVIAGIDALAFIIHLANMGVIAEKRKTIYLDLASDLNYYNYYSYGKNS